MIKILQEMDFHLSHELNSERQKRESTEEMLLRLLEETCNRVDSSIKRYWDNILNCILINEMKNYVPF